MVEPARQQRGQRANLSGEAAERQVVRDYARRGIPVLHRRWRGQRGEIDVIARDGETVVFVEVKQARSLASAAHRLTSRQMERLYGTAEEYLATQPKGQLTEVRFDVALVGGQGEIQIIENAFGHD